MTFDEAQRRYEELRRQRQAGQINDEQLQQEVGRLQVKDEAGYSWRIDLLQGWVYWNGDAWVPHPSRDSSSREAAEQARTPQPTDTGSRDSKPAGDAQDLVRQASRWGRSAVALLQGRLPSPQLFLKQARNVPMAKRSQGWWDALAIGGGTLAGFLWFLYTSVRGMPHVTFMGLAHESWFDFLPPLMMVGGVIGAILLRRQLRRLLSPLLAPLRRIPFAGKLGGGLALVAGGLVIRYGTGLFQRREGLDLITPLIMIGLPTCLVLFRQPIDRLLWPLDRIRRNVPRLLLIGIGLAVPYLIAVMLYRLGGLVMYPYLRVSVVIGTIVSYAIIRTPQAPAMRPATAGAEPGARARANAMIWLFGIALAHALLLATPLYADDFFRDPFNANDGLRTDTVAPIMAGTATVVVVALVNGAEVVRTIIQGKVDEEDEGKRKDFQIQIETVDGTGAVSTKLESDLCEELLIYGKCYEVGKGAFPAGDETLEFMLVGAEEHVVLTDLGYSEGKRCASVQIVDPLPVGVAAPKTFTVNVSAGAGGSLMTIPVVLSLSISEYILRFH
jgi:hypothetical protein